MKKFTVKDFLKLNSPCYSCGKKVNIHAIVHIDGMSSVNLNVSITPAGFIIPLSITYNNNLKLIIEPKTNRFIINNEANFIKYIKDHKVCLAVDCDECLTFMASQYLEFNLVEGYIKPVGISNQLLILSDKNNRYVINSEFMTDETTIMVFSIIDEDIAIASSFSELKLPLLPHYRFKDKQHFISKIKTYLLFS